MSYRNKPCYVEKAKSIGEQILKQLTGKMVKDHTFKAQKQALTMDGKIIECGQDKVHVDPQLLFQRLVIVAKGSIEGMASVFRYELLVFHWLYSNFLVLCGNANKPVLANVTTLQIMKCSLWIVVTTHH